MDNNYKDDPYVQTMISNMPDKTGKSLENWFEIIESTNLSKHGEIMNLLKKTHKVSHGFANTITLLYRQKQAGGPPSDASLIEAQYKKKPQLLPVFNQIIQKVKTFGDDVEVAPKKSYVSLRRAKQFAIIQPSTKTRMDLGLNLQGDFNTDGILNEGDRWNGMCTHLIEIKDLSNLSDEVYSWLKIAYDQAG